MSELNLFPRERVAGVFRGFSHGGLEFHADIVLPYRERFHSEPMHGQFLLVQLASDEEAVLGRVTSLHSEGRLVSSEGEDFGLRAVAEGRPIPEDLMEQYVKYRVNLRVLGVLRQRPEGLVFAPSHRRLPHVGSKVAFPSDEVLMEIAAHNVAGADLGFLTFGEFIYAGTDRRLRREPWHQVRSPAIIAKFPVSQLVSRRTFVFARAGFGKSNLVKLLFSNLYRETPTVEKRGGRKVPVGTVIFDPEGEYFWPDEKGRPGLCDVPELEDKVVVFTSRRPPSDFYGSFVAGGIRLDIRRLRPADVVGLALSPDRQEQQNVRKLKGLCREEWEALVNEIEANGNATDLRVIKRILKLDDQSDAEATAARSNMTFIVNMLHDKSSRMMDMLLAALREGKLCVVDVSQLRGGPALIMTGLILQRIFDTNQDEFTKKEPRTIPTIAVLEEAQAVLGQEPRLTETPYVTWVKEGRKYDLGAVLITQQPGSIRQELLSQGDNWFVFHLLSAGDLVAVQKANAHFSEDILASLLNEPIPGHCAFWSSSGGKAYPLSLRVLSFEDATPRRDLDYDRPAVRTSATELKERFDRELAEAVGRLGELTYQIPETSMIVPEGNVRAQPAEEQAPDAFDIIRRAAFEELRRNGQLWARVRSNGVPWRQLVEALEALLPQDMDLRDSIHEMVRSALDAVLGKDNWHTEKRPSKSEPGKTTLWVVAKEGRGS